MVSSSSAPLIAHIIYRFDVGGLENGLVNLINNLPEDRFRHAIICLTTAGSFESRITRSDVAVLTLEKRPGKDFGMYLRLWRLLRGLKPTVVHTRNLAALDCQLVALLARVPVRIHGEHGWDVFDLHGTNTKYRLLRKICRLAVQVYIPMSQHLADWLKRSVGVKESRIRQIYNGVDTERFCPKMLGAQRSLTPQASDAKCVVGTVGRLEAVKDQATLIRAVLHVRATHPEVYRRLRLVIVGDGVLNSELRTLLREAATGEEIQITGSRDDIPEMLRTMDVFVLPSLNEGISNTILEAMASGLPVVATDVGGNPELVVPESTGGLVPASNPQAMAAAIVRYVSNPDLARAHGKAGRERVTKHFSLKAMITGYQRIYDEALGQANF